MTKNSALYLKKTKAQCHSTSSYVQNLQNGRQCNTDNQCYSRHCSASATIPGVNVCQGRTYGQFCYNHGDCNNGYFCNQSSSWPYISMCMLQLADYAPCTSDYQCPNSDYCWYRSPQDLALGVMRCLPLYSQPSGTTFGWYQQNASASATYKDFEGNGKYC